MSSFAYRLLPQDRDPVTPGSGQSSVFKLCIVLQLVGLVVAGAGIMKLRAQAAGIPKIVAFTADHRAIIGEPKTYQMDDDRFGAFARDTVEAALARTEKGIPPALQDYVTDAAGKKLLAQALSIRPRAGASFVQTFQVAEKDGVRLVSGNMMTARIKLRGVLTTRSTDSMVSDTYYWGAQFVSGPLSVENPIGWRLTDLFEISMDDYYEEDAAIAAADAVKLPARKKP